MANFQVLSDQNIPAWDHFVSAHPDSSIYHYSIWGEIWKKAFQKQWHVIGCVDNGIVKGGVPLVHMHSPWFGNFLVSVPYVNYGGFLVEHEEMVEPLFREVNKFGDHLGVKYIEFRHLKNFFPDLPMKCEKVSMWLSLPENAEILFKNFKPKLRSQIRKGEKNGLTLKRGGLDLLDEFYKVFSQNMRDLGTPVYGKDIFQYILQCFPKTSRIIVVRDQTSRPLAAGFLLGHRHRLEIPWASSLRAYNHLQTNMFLYWDCLKYACEEGYAVFDFGRSSQGASTYKFKEQWGAMPVPHFWHYRLNAGESLPQLNPQSQKFRMAIGIWKRLPLVVANHLGPSVAKHLP